MINTFISLFTAVQLLLTGAMSPQGQLQLLFRSGTMLRMHVVAQDDTEDMQRLKLCVRDAVQLCYTENRPDGNDSMLENTRAILPLLTKAAEDCARAHGFDGDVRVELGVFSFGELPLATLSVPAGEYPALMIFLGDAAGHNWWGLIDPETATWFARIPNSSDTSSPNPAWDWSWQGFLNALLGRESPLKEVQHDAPHP